MKLILTWLMTIAFVQNAYPQDKLYYFIHPVDSFMGVKDDKGNIIIPARYEHFWTRYEDYFTNPITDSVLVLMGGEPYHDEDRTIPSWSAGDAYDRKGNLLYHPLSYDNGPDYFSEGLTRCVDNHKVGFVNRLGKMIIQPQYDWVSEFNYGYAFACNGCYLNRNKDPEHPSIEYKNDADTFYVNRKGERVAPLKKQDDPRDQKVGNYYLPYPFSYTASEQKLVDSFNSITIIRKIAYGNHYPLRTGKETNIQFEIIERPATQTEGYKLMGYYWQEGHYYKREDLMFTVSHDGKWHQDGYEGPVPYKVWLHENLQEFKIYFDNNPDAPNKFDVDKYLKN